MTSSVGAKGWSTLLELLLRSFELLQAQPALCHHYRSRFRHLLVDEFQDTNTLQYRWIRLLAGPGAAVFAVGDDDQSIYAFRGANVGNMAAFERDFQTPNLIRLEQNYRSFGHILDCANELIQRNANRLGQATLDRGRRWRTGPGSGGLERSGRGPMDRRGGARSGARWVDASGYRPTVPIERPIPSARARPVRSRNALIGSTVGYRFPNGPKSSMHWAYLRLIENPADDGAFLRVVNFPTAGSVPDRSSSCRTPRARARLLALRRRP
jgi:DNA helicase-2/ATP-dependent DNA helicase PcrA